MLKILYAGCLGLSLAISSQFSVEMCAASKNCEKIYYKPFFGSSVPFKVIDVDKSKKPVTGVVMISSTSVPICNRFYTIRGNNGKITSFRGHLSLTPSFEGNSHTHGHEILSR